MISHNNGFNNNLGTPLIKTNNYIMSQAATTMFAFANSENEALMVNIGSGYTQAYIFNLNENVFYHKQIDAAGNIVAFDTYEYTKRIPPEPEKPVTHDDLLAMQNDILNQIAAMIKKEDDVVG